MNCTAERTAPIEEIKEVILQRGLTECFTDQELKHAFNGKHYSRLAVRLLAKQLIMEKNQGIFAYKDLEILNDEFGKPCLNILNPGSVSSVRQEKLKRILLSLSHSRKYARALVIFEYF